MTTIGSKDKQNYPQCHHRFRSNSGPVECMGAIVNFPESFHTQSHWKVVSDSLLAFLHWNHKSVYSNITNTISVIFRCFWSDTCDFEISYLNDWKSLPKNLRYIKGPKRYSKSDPWDGPDLFRSVFPNMSSDLKFYDSLVKLEILRHWIVRFLILIRFAIQKCLGQRIPEIIWIEIDWVLTNISWGTSICNWH